MISSYYYPAIQADWRETLSGSISPKNNSMKVFLVDDSLVIRERLKRMLADVQDVQVIGEAGDALVMTSDAILKQKPDVVLLDIHLVDGSGIDVLQRLKKAKPAPV